MSCSDLLSEVLGFGIHCRRSMSGYAVDNKICFENVRAIALKVLVVHMVQQHVKIWTLETKVASLYITEMLLDLAWKFKRVLLL